MAEDCILNTYNFSVALPIDESSPPTTSFTVTFFCNGVTFTSDQFITAEEALDYVEENWSSFGVWSLSGNTLYLTGSLCSTGSLTTQSYSEETGEELLLELDDTAPETIDDILGGSFTDVSVNHQRVGDTDWLTPMAAIDFAYGDQFTDPTSQWNHNIDGDGYNIYLADAVARGKTLATVLDGVGNKTYGYDFFFDEYSQYLPTIGITESVLSLNICAPLIQVIGTNPVNVGGINFTTFFAELEFYIARLLTSSITTRRFQLCTEMGINNQSDLIHSAADYNNVCIPIISYLRTHYPTIPITADAYEVDATHQFLANYNSTINTLDIDGARQYYQFDEDLVTYQQNRDRIYELNNVLSEFTQQFTGGKTCVLQQSVVKPSNPFALKTGEGLIYAEFYINVIKENIERNGLITDLTFYPSSRLIGGTNTINPAYYFIKLIRGAFNNNGKISATIDDSDLKILSVKKGSATESYIVNPTADLKIIDGVSVNGTAKTLSVESYYGNPSSAAPAHYTATGASAIIHPYSLTKIVTS